MSLRRLTSVEESCERLRLQLWYVDVINQHGESRSLKEFLMNVEGSDLVFKVY